MRQLILIQKILFNQIFMKVTTVHCKLVSIKMLTKIAIIIKLFYIVSIFFDKNLTI